MSRFTDYAENKLIDMMRGQGLTLPSSWYVGALSASGDPAANITELSWTGYARVPVLRSLAKWAGTQGSGTTTASSGSTHTTTNNEVIDFGTPGSTGGTCRAIGLFDAATGGNCWMTAQLTSFVSIVSGTPFPVDVGTVSFALGTTGGMSDYLANKLVDLIWRGQAYTWPATLYAALYATAPGNGDDTSGEVAVASYAREPIASTLTAWSGTQLAGSTSASTGTGGEMSNNNVVTFPTPAEEWGVLTHGGLRDASAAGNLMFWGELGQAGTVRAYSTAPAYQAGALKVKVA